MTQASITGSERLAARIAGLAMVLPFAIVVFAEFAILEKLNVPGDAAQTAQNILAHVQQFRLGIACDVLYGFGTVVLLTALYVIFRPLNRGLALAAAFFRLIYALMWFAIAGDYFQALRILGNAPYLAAFSTVQLQSLAKLSMSSGFDAYYIGLLFFGLASTICSYLWFRSRYIPRFLSAYGLAASAWCVFCTFCFYVIPDFDKTVGLSWFDVPLGLFELTTGFWLLIRGLKTPAR